MKFKFITIFVLAFALLLSACGKSDADLQKTAETAVKAKAPTATVVVKDGVATLTGQVDNDAAKAAAETAAKVEGVKSVKNELTVKPTAPPVVPDPATKTAVEEALKKKGLTDVTVEATSTEVTIRGTVPKGKLAEAMQTATETAKRKVNNQVSEK